MKLELTARLFLLLVFSGTILAADRPKIAPADLSSQPVFFGALLEPPKGRVYHGWGEFSGLWNQGVAAGAADEQDLSAYEQAMKPYSPVMLSFYTAPDLQMVPPFLHRYEDLVARRGCFVAEVGLYFQSIQAQVASGARDTEIAMLADGLLESHNPVLLRIGYEFNNPWVLYDSGKYVKSFRSIVGLLRARHASNVAAVWNATPTGFKAANYMDWYPGDDVVDWWSINIFDLDDFDRPEVAAFLDAARAHHKPVLIGEASPIMRRTIPSFGWIPLPLVRGPASETEAAEWYSKFIELIRRRPEIQAVTLISLDWHRLRSELGIAIFGPTWGWPDARITQWPEALELWKAAISDPRFVSAKECASIIGK